MIRTILTATILSSAIAGAVIAQDTKAPTLPSATTTPDAMPTPGATTTPAMTTAPMAAPPAVDSIILTEQEGKSWVDKPIFSSDGKKIGEVVAFQRDASNKVLGLHIDIGGFLGIMQTRVSVMPAQFKLQNDRVLIDLTAEQAKSLPKIQS